VLLLGIAAMTCPVLAQPSCEMVVHQDDDGCHTQGGGALPHTESAADDVSAQNDCCAAGCLDCGLPCCTGVAMVLSVTPAVDSFACLRVQLLPGIDDLPSVDPDPIYHPPRC